MGIGSPVAGEVVLARFMLFGEQAWVCLGNEG